MRHSAQSVISKRILPVTSTLPLFGSTRCSLRCTLRHPAASLFPGRGGRVTGVGRGREGESARRARGSRIDAQGSTRLITIHQVHRQSHMKIHDDSSLCSLLGVYPLEDALCTTDRAARLVPRSADQVGDIGSSIQMGPGRAEIGRLQKPLLTTT